MCCKKCEKNVKTAGQVQYVSVNQQQEAVGSSHRFSSCKLRTLLGLVLDGVWLRYVGQQ
jgi:hypothetical protein